MLLGSGFIPLNGSDFGKTIRDYLHIRISERAYSTFDKCGTKTRQFVFLWGSVLSKRKGLCYNNLKTVLRCRPAARTAEKKLTLSLIFKNILLKKHNNLKTVLRCRPAARTAPEKKLTLSLIFKNILLKKHNNLKTALRCRPAARTAQRKS